MDRQEAIKIVKSNLPEGRQMLSEALEFLIPELKESEDDRIRKQLIAVVELYYGETDEQEKKDCLSWLEKQGEQKPAWSEEDEKEYRRVEYAIMKVFGSDAYLIGWIRKFKNKLLHQTA